MKKRNILLFLIVSFALLGLISCDKEEIKPEDNPPIAEVTKYNVTFNTDGGNSIASQSVESGKYVVKPANPMKKGYEFKGWYKEETCTNVWNFEKDVVTENITLYAKWERVEMPTIRYTISFDMHNHGEAPGEIENVTALPTVLPKVADIEGYHFAGWYEDEKYTIPAVAGKPITEDVILHAKWVKKIQGIEFEDKIVFYTGAPHSICITGSLPEGVMVTYTGNNKTEVGIYTITAHLTGGEYESLDLKATLTITKAQFQGITFIDEKFEYDGTAHKIEIIGQIPEETKVEYSCLEDKGITNLATETGTYTITATLTNKNYETLILTAKMTIVGSEDERHIIYYGDTLYFANALDQDRLYSYKNGNVTKISHDTPYHFTILNNNLYFRSKSLISSIKELKNGSVSTVASEKGEYLCTDGRYLYYAVNGLTNGKSGIYCFDPTIQEATPVLVSSGKAKYLQYYNGYLYFADGTADWKLSRISLNNPNIREIILEEKITCLIQESGVLYFTVDRLLGNYIASYTISTGKLVKLTSDAGSNLTIVGNDLYYLNVDLLTSNIFGKGIYKVSAIRTSDSNLPGTKVVGEENESYSSLTLAGNELAYYKVSTQMLCLYDFSTERTTQILEGFVAPEIIPLSTGSKVLTYENKIYYLDLYNEKALYSFAPTTNNHLRITSNKVSDFSIICDTLYFNQVSYGVNNNLYRVDLKQGGVPELISKNDCVDIVSDGTNLYYVEKNVAGARTAIHKISPDQQDTILYSKGVDYLTFYKGYLYFVDGKDLLKISVSDPSNTVITVKKGNVDNFVIYNDAIYFRKMYGLAWKNKNLSKMNLDGENEIVICETDTDPIKLVIFNNKLFYYSDLIKENGSGIYAIDLTNPSSNSELILARNSKYFASDFTILNGNIYFINYYNNLGDSHLYEVNISSKTINKID